MDNNETTNLVAEELKSEYIDNLLRWNMAGIEGDDVEKANKLSDEGLEIEKKIFSQGKQSLFLELIDHPERVVRFSAAGVALILNEPKARQVLEELAKGGFYSLEAKYALIEFDKGPLKERLQKLLALSEKVPKTTE